MLGFPHGDPMGAKADGEHDRLVAVPLVVAGGLFVLAILSHRWPQAWMPPGSVGIERAYDVRLLKSMLLLEGVGLVGLGVLAAGRRTWLRHLGGVAGLGSRVPAALALLLVAHAAALLFYLPPQQLLSPEPVHSGAHLARFYRIFSAHRLLSMGRTWGYDPFFLAGCPAGLAVDLDTRGDALFAHLGSFLGLAYASKAYIVLVDGLVPLTLYAAARILGLRRDAALLAALLGILHWHWGRPVLGSLRWLGAHSYLLACQMAILGIASAIRFHDRDRRLRRRCFAALVVVACTLGLVHPAGLLLFVPSACVALSMGLRRLRHRDRAALVVLLVLVAAVQIPWLVPYVQQRRLLGGGDPPVQLGGPVELLAVFCRPTSAIALAILLLGAIGLWMRRRSEPRLAWTVAGSALAWLACVAFAARLPFLSRLECARALVPAVLLLALPAGATLCAALAAAQRRVGPMVVTLGLLVACTLPAFLAVLDTRFYYVHRLRAQLDSGFGELVAAVDSTAPPDARLLFESTANARTALSEGSSLEALLPIYTRRELVGGPEPGAPLAPPALGFGSGELGSRPLAAWTPEEFVALLRRYDVGAVVAWSPEARAFLSVQLGTLERAASVRGFEVYRVTGEGNRLARGTARVRAGYDRIEIDALGSEDLVLKYHWVPGLRAAPGVDLERFPVDGDPVGFIRLRPRGARQVILRTGG